MSGKGWIATAVLMLAVVTRVDAAEVAGIADLQAEERSARIRSDLNAVRTWRAGLWSG